MWEGGEDLRLLKLPEEYLEQRLKHGGMTIRVVAVGNDGLAVTEDHGLFRLSDDKQEQGRAWVARKCGMPMITTRLPIGKKHAKVPRRLHVEQRLVEVQYE